MKANYSQLRLWSSTTSNAREAFRLYFAPLRSLARALVAQRRESARERLRILTRDSEAIRQQLQDLTQTLKVIQGREREQGPERQWRFIVEGAPYGVALWNR